MRWRAPEPEAKGCAVHGSRAEAERLKNVKTSLNECSYRWKGMHRLAHALPLVASSSFERYRSFSTRTCGFS
jgi:hypothetical protein